RCAAKSSKKSLRAESLRARRAQKARLDVYASHQKLRGSELPHEMSYPTKKTLQYAVTPAQESGLAFHMFRHLGIAIGISTASAVLRSRQRLPNAARAALTAPWPRLRCCRVPPSKRRHVCFRTALPLMRRRQCGIMESA